MALLDLPPEIINIVASYLFPLDLLHLAHASTRLQASLASEVLNIQQNLQEYNPDNNIVHLSELISNDYELDRTIDDPEGDEALAWTAAAFQRLANNPIVALYISEQIPSVNTLINVLTPAGNDDDAAGSQTEYLDPWLNEQLIVSFCIVSLPSVVFLEIILEDEARQTFAEILTKAETSRQWVFPGLKNFKMVQYHSDYADEEYRDPDFTEAKTILKFFDTCQREFVLQRENDEDVWGRPILCHIRPPAADRSDLPVSIDWCFYPRLRPFTRRLVPGVQQLLEHFPHSQRWNLIDEELHRHDTQQIFARGSRIEAINVTTSKKGTLFQDDQTSDSNQLET